MSILLAYTFNEQSFTPADYSGNKQTGSSLNVAFASGKSYGHAVELGQVNMQSYVSVSPTNFTGLAGFSMFTSFNLLTMPTSGQVGYIYYQASSSNCYITSAGNVVFRLTSSGVTHTLTSAGIITTGWNTICCTWDGTTMYLYLNGLVDSNTLSLSPFDATNNTIYIGNDSGTDNLNTLIGNMDHIEFRNRALSGPEVSVLDSSPGGYYVQNNQNNFSLGDLIADNTVSNWACVTWVVDINNFYILPLSGSSDGSYAKIGNIYQANRQYYMEMSTDFDGNGNGQVSVKYPIAGIADYSSPANTITFDYRGLSGAPSTLQNMMAITSLRI